MYSGKLYVVKKWKSDVQEPNYVKKFQKRQPSTADYATSVSLKSLLSLFSSTTMFSF